MIALHKENAGWIARRLRTEVHSGLPLEEVIEIINEVRRNGDDAIIRFEEMFDGVKLSRDSIAVDPSEIDRAVKALPVDLLRSIRTCIERLEQVERKFMEGLVKEVKIEFDSVAITYEFAPLDRVGVYVPRSRFSYPSSLIMAAVPARVAGVRSIVVTTPPDRNRNVDAAVLAVCKMLEIEEVYRIGGAQAIAALAYGTETIKPVQKIVGPGGRYATVAKFIASINTDIEFLAGPTELLVLADGSADPKFVAYDLLSQAEHGPDSIIVLAATSEDVANSVISHLRQTGFGVEVLDRLIVVIGDLESLIKFVEEFGPEHAQIMTSNANEVSKRIKSAGVVLIGDYTPSAASDYILGTNHILPTFGLARGRGGLSPLDFMKRVARVQASREFLLKYGDDIMRLAKYEGFLWHKKAVEVRVYERG